MKSASVLTLALLTMALLAVESSWIVASAQSDQRPVVRKDRPNAAKYSLKIWSRNSLGQGQSVSAMTPYGRLSCMGALMNDRPRSCHWN
jgi:hypothetical protein